MAPQSFGKTLSRLTDHGLWALFTVCLAFAALTACYNPWISLAELAVTLALGFGFYRSADRRRKAVLAHLDSMTRGADFASRRTMLASPLS